MAIALVGSLGTIATGTTASLTPTFPQATSAGNLLLGMMVANKNNASTVTGPSGWAKAVEVAPGTGIELAIWYKPNCSASETAPTFNVSTATVMQAMLAEYSGADTVSPLDQTGTNTGTTSPRTVTATAADATATDLVAVLGGWRNTSAATTGTFADSTGFGGIDNGGTSLLFHLRYVWQVLTAGGVTADTDQQSYTGAVSSCGLVLASFKAAVSAIPFKNPASFMVQENQGGRPARRRVGYWHSVIGQTSTVLTETAAEAPTTPLAQPLVMATPRGRPQRRRAGQGHQNEGATQTAYQDQVLSQGSERGYRPSLPLFRNWERPASWWVNLMQFVVPPLRQLAGSFVQAGRGGRRPRRSGVQALLGDQVNSVLLSTLEVPQAQPAQTLVQASRNARPARRRRGQWHRNEGATVTAYQDQVIGQASVRSWRAPVPWFRAWQVSGSWFANLVQYVYPPFRQLAAVFVVAGKARRPRRNAGWPQVADQVSTTLLASAEQKQVQLADSFVSRSWAGRAGRRRSNAWHRASAETRTIYQDQVLGQQSARSWRSSIPRFRNWEQPAANFLLNALLPPLRQLAAACVLIGRGGRRAARRVGFWHTSADQVNSSLLDAAEAIQRQPVQSLVQVGPRGRGQRRRTGQWHQASSETKTFYGDRVISQDAGRSWRQRLPRFLNWEQSGARLAGWLNQPFRQLAAYLAVAGKGRRPRKAAGWHETVDYVNTTMLLSTELPQVQTAEVEVQSGRGRRPARRRSGLWHNAATETKTLYADQVVSSSRERTPARRVPLLRGWWNSLLVFLSQAVAPLTRLRYYLSSQEPPLTLSSSEANANLEDREPPNGQGSNVRGQ